MRKAILVATFIWVLCITACVHCNRTCPRNPKFYGYASWYSAEDESKLTASGEKFDGTKLTAAHKTLPFGTYVRVTRLDCGKSVTVRINDRGPFKRRRIIDLTQAGADKLDLFEIGITRVRVEVLGKTPPNTP